MAELKWRRYPAGGMPANITGNFGDWYAGATHPHLGTDVGIVVGTPIYAPADGVVSPMLNDGSFGLAVCLDHLDTPWYSLYAHLSEPLVSIGETVKAGTMIGLSGNTGYSSGPHLHWQVCDSNQFPTDISHSTDPMGIPFETEEDETMTPDERELLLLVAGVVGGWTNGKRFDTVEEALPSFQTFEEQDQRVLVGMGILNGAINETINILALHMAGHRGMSHRRLGELVNRLDTAQYEALATLNFPTEWLPPEPPGPGEVGNDIEITGETGTLKEDGAGA